MQTIAPFALSLLTHDQRLALESALEQLRESARISAQHSFDSCIAANIASEIAQMQAQEVFEQRMLHGQSALRVQLHQHYQAQLQILFQKQQEVYRSLRDVVMPTTIPFAALSSASVSASLSPSSWPSA